VDRKEKKNRYGEEKATRKILEGKGLENEYAVRPERSRIREKDEELWNEKMKLLKKNQITHAPERKDHKGRLGKFLAKSKERGFMISTRRGNGKEGKGIEETSRHAGMEKKAAKRGGENTFANCAKSTRGWKRGGPGTRETGKKKERYHKGSSTEK